MLTIKAPETYACEPGLLEHAGELVSKYGRRAFIIAGERAWQAVEKTLAPGLEAWHIAWARQTLRGYPTCEKALDLVSQSAQARADLIIGIGGGKVCDMAKAVANLRGIPAVNIPTVAGTCACWAARSILYTEDGDFDRILWNAANPSMVLADVDVLIRAPKRYLASGIMDTLAKWYEFEPLIEAEPGDIVLRQDVAVAKLAKDILEALGPGAMADGPDPEAFRQVLDAIFFLAGATGSFANGAAYQGFAHPWYYATTRVPESRHRLHGEKVAFGLLVQFILKEKPRAFIDEYLRQLVFYGITDVPGDWHTADEAGTIRALAERVLNEYPGMVEKGFARDSAHCAQAIEEASELLRSSRTYGK